MFVVLLKFSANKPSAPEFMAAHNVWIKQGIDDGVFAVVGSLQPNLGGAIVAHGATLAELEQRLREDPFIAHDIVTSEILEITPSKTDSRLAFLLNS